ncbi:MAG: flagellar basal body P-ring formation chaperone FlgA [Hyphomicrobiales bacterium]
MKHLATLLLGGLIGLSATLPARAEGGVPLLKADVAVTSELVTVGDLFDHPGLKAETAVFRAPDIGTRGTVSAEAVAAAAKAVGITNIDLGGLTEITVTRLSRVVSAEDFADFVTGAIANAAGLADKRRLSVAFDTPPQAIHASPTAREPLKLTGLAYSRISGRFEVAVLPTAPGAEAIRLSGTAIELFEIPVLTRSLSRGDVIRQGDIKFDRVPRNRLPREATAEIGAVVGMAARRPIAAGAPLKAEDFRAPLLVQRNDIVTIIFSINGMSLTARGQVLDAGGKGDLVSVRNVQSKKILQAEVTGAGVVEVYSAGGRMAAIAGGVQ